MPAPAPRSRLVSRASSLQRPQGMPSTKFAAIFRQEHRAVRDLLLDLVFPTSDPKVVEEVFRHLVLRQLHRAKRLSEKFLRSLLGWRRSGSRRSTSPGALSGFCPRTLSEKPQQDPTTRRESARSNWALSANRCRLLADRVWADENRDRATTAATPRFPHSQQPWTPEGLHAIPNRWTPVVESVR